MDYLRKEKERGRQIVLATAAHKLIADKVSSQLGLFDKVLATQAGQNLKGKAKLHAIQNNVGESFVYAGDSDVDIPIWKASKAAILVRVSPKTAEKVRLEVPIEHEIPKENIGLDVWLSALRVHQWMKNLLLFVPMLTGFSFLEIEKLVTMILAFFAFSFAASATYLIAESLFFFAQWLLKRRGLVRSAVFLQQ